MAANNKNTPSPRSATDSTRSARREPSSKFEKREEKNKEAFFKNVTKQLGAKQDVSLRAQGKANVELAKTNSQLDLIAVLTAAITKYLEDFVQSFNIMDDIRELTQNTKSSEANTKKFLNNVLNGDQAKAEQDRKMLEALNSISKKLTPATKDKITHEKKSTNKSGLGFFGWLFILLGAAYTLKKILYKFGRISKIADTFKTIGLWFERIGGWFNTTRLGKWLNQNKTLRSMRIGLELIKDYLSSTRIGKIFISMKNGLSRYVIRPIIEWSRTALKWASELGRFLPSKMGFIGRSLKFLGKTFLKLVRVLGLPLDFLLGTVASIKAMWKTFANGDGSWQSLGEGVINGLVAFANGIFGWAVDGIAWLTGWIMKKFGYEDLGEKFMNFDFSDWFKGIFDSLEKWLTVVISDSQILISDVVTDIGNGITDFFDWIGKSFTDAWKWISDKFDIAKENVAASWAKLGDWFGNMQKITENFAKSILNSFLPRYNPAESVWSVNNATTKLIPEDLYKFAGIEKKTGKDIVEKKTMSAPRNQSFKDLEKSRPELMSEGMFAPTVNHNYYNNSVTQPISVTQVLPSSWTRTTQRANE